MYKFTHGLLPPGFNDYFCTQSDIHTYNTRTASHSALGISFARTNRRKKSLKTIGPYLLNDLPLNIRQSKSIASFKYHPKELPVTKQLTSVVHLHLAPFPFSSYIFCHPHLMYYIYRPIYIYI